MRDLANQIDRLRARIVHEMLSDDEFTAELAEIVAATPERMEAVDGLLLSQEIWDLQKKWLKTRH